MKRKIMMVCAMGVMLIMARADADCINVMAEEKVLYRIETSAGNNLGMSPVVGGSAVVLINGRSVSVRQGEYLPPEQSKFSLKLEEAIRKAASDGVMGAWIFYRESKLQEFVILEGVTTIEKFAFARSGLRSMVIPDGVTTIGVGAFYHCDFLTEVTIPDSVTTIERNAFTHTPWLNNWLAGKDVSGNEVSGNGVSNKEVSGNKVSGNDTSKFSDSGDFLIVGDGILLAYRGNEENPELPPEVKSVAEGALKE